MTDKIYYVTEKFIQDKIKEGLKKVINDFHKKVYDKWDKKEKKDISSDEGRFIRWFLFELNDLKNKQQKLGELK